jgi:hypothetical protein
VRRIVAALGRYKWLIALLAGLGLAGGALASRFVEPEYQVQSTLYVPNVASTAGSQRGPIRDGQVFDEKGWLGLLRTYAIADSVVLKLALYVEPDRAADSTLFRSFQLNPRSERFFPGEYTLSVKGPTWSLRDAVGAVSEEGMAGDSIGRRAGFAWAPTKAQLGERTVKFRVRQPREVSNDIIARRLNVGLAEGAGLIQLSLRGKLQQKPAETLNAWGEEFVKIATRLKAARVTASSKVLEEQRAEAERRLTAAERAYEQFRVGTITLPSDAMSIQPGLGGGAAVRNDPAVDNYTSSKYALEALRRDRVAIERVRAQMRPNYVPVEALLAIGLVTGDPGRLSPAARPRGPRGRERAAARAAPHHDRQQPAGAHQARAAAHAAGAVGPAVAQLVPRRHPPARGAARGRRDAELGELQRIPQRATEQGALRRDRDAAEELFRAAGPALPRGTARREERHARRGRARRGRAPVGAHRQHGAAPHRLGSPPGSASGWRWLCSSTASTGDSATRSRRRTASACRSSARCPWSTRPGRSRRSGWRRSSRRSARSV